MTSRSSTTIEHRTDAGEGPDTETVGHRLPSNRAPTHPGEMLLEEFIKPLGITQTAFAARLGVSYPRLNELIHGKRSLTPDTALRLERVLGMTAGFWLGLQQDWDLWHARRGEDAAVIAELEPIYRVDGE